MSAIKRKIARRKHRDDSDVFLEDDHRRDVDRGENKGFFQKYLSRSLQNLDDLYCLDDDGEVELDNESVISLPLTATTVTDNEGSDYDQQFAEPTRQLKVAQVLPNNNQLDKPNPHSPRSNGHAGRYGNHIRSPEGGRLMSPRARIGDGSEDVTTMTDGYDPALVDNDLNISNQDNMFHPLDWDYTLNESNMVADTTLKEVNPSHRSPKSHSQLSSYSKVSHHPLNKSPRQHGAFGGIGYGPPDYTAYPGPTDLGLGSRSAGNPVPFHTKMNLTQWQQNLDSHFGLQQQMQHLQLNTGYHPFGRSGTGHDMHVHNAGMGYPVGDSNFSFGPVRGSESTNLEGLIRAKENMLHERNIIIERQKLEIAHLTKQNDEQENIARQRIYTRSRDEGDMLFLKMQEYQYEIASLRAQLAEISTAKLAEGEQLSRKLGEVEESQVSNEMTINDLKTKLKLKEAELQEVKGQLLHSKKDYEKLKKKLSKIEKYMQNLPTAEEYRESCDTIRDLREEEELLRERIVSLEASLSKAKQKTHRSKQESSDLEEKNLSQQMEIERMKKELSKLQKAIGSKETGDPTDLELCSREDIEQLREENKRHSSSVDHLKKVIDSKHHHLQKIQKEHQRALDEMESRLMQEEGVITALRVELKNKDSSIQDMTRSMKELASQSQELYGHNLSLQESVQNLERQVSSDKARCTSQLVKELSQCVQELQRLVELINQRAEGQEPNVSLLLGFRPSSAMSFDVDDDEKAGSEDMIRAMLTQVHKLRGDIDLIRSLISDRYAEDVGASCITQ
nr:centrosomal protein of 85 kDa-like [Lytechinus pictus]